MNKKWTALDIPDLKGKTVIITGANSGLGWQASLELARKKARVIMAVRNRDKGQEAKDRILTLVPDSEIFVMKLDLANIESIKHFADTFHEEFQQLDILINNAGVMALPLMRTAQGFEMQFGVNHLGHFVLTALLIDIINKTRGSRIINVSSLAYRNGEINFDDLNWEKSYSKWKAYNQSKLANLLFTIELDRRLDLAGKGTLTAAAHPGFAATNLQIRGPELEGSGFKKVFFQFANLIAAQSASMGVLPILFAATSSETKKGGFYGPDGLLKMRGYPAEDIMDPSRVKPMEALRLWEASEKLMGIKFTVR